MLNDSEQEGQGEQSEERFHENSPRQHLPPTALKCNQKASRQRYSENDSCGRIKYAVGGCTEYCLRDTLRICDWPPSTGICNMDRPRLSSPSSCRRAGLSQLWTPR